MNEKKETKQRLSQRHDPQILDDLKRVSDESGLSQVALIAASITGLRKTWDQNHQLTFPFVVVPEKNHQQQPQITTKPGTTYGNLPKTQQAIDDLKPKNQEQIS
jgi:hypothetical protein